MKEGLGLFVAKFGEKDYRYALSKSDHYVRSHPKQYFQEDKSFSSMDEAISFGRQFLNERGVEIFTSFIGDFSKTLSSDDEWDNHVGDMVMF